VPRCYLLAASTGSSVDQHSNNVTLFNLVEQINVAPGAPPPPGGVLPLEIHAYYELGAPEIGQAFSTRFALVARASGLETFSDVFSHKAVTARYRTRVMGLPFPPVTGQYDLRVDWRFQEARGWTREAIAWPVAIVEADPRPRVTH
jgi:hypothetical protein